MPRTRHIQAWLLKADGLARSRRDGKTVMYERTERGRALVELAAGARA